MTRFGFSIRTKSGQRVDNIQIIAANANDAERRLRQMYQQCEIVERREQTVGQRIDARNDANAKSPVHPPLSARKSGTL